jgi:CheY-like chemotaxis protein
MEPSRFGLRWEGSKQPRKSASKRGSGAHVPIIGMTAHAMNGDRERCLGAGMDDYMSNPICAADLIELLEKYH